MAGSLPSTTSSRSRFERAVRGYMRPSMRSGWSDVRTPPGLASDAPRSRRVLFDLLESWPFLAITMLVISANAVFIVLEANLTAACASGDGCEPGYELISCFFLVFYAIELMLRMYASRCEFWNNHTNLLDLFVVILGTSDVILQRWSLTSSPNLSAAGILRIVRITRVARLWRLVSFFPELYAMLKGLFNAVRAMFWGTIMIFALLAIFAVVTVELVYPVAYEIGKDDAIIADCASGFATVQEALLILFQTTVIGDTSRSCAVQLILDHDQWWVLILLCTVVACIQLGLVNLVLSAILDSTLSDRDADREVLLGVEYEREREAVGRMLEIMQHIDVDGDGFIDSADLAAGYRDSKELRDLLKDMEIDQHDMCIMFDMMDADRDGKCPYGEFIESLQKSQAQDVKLQLLFLKLQMSQIKTALTRCIQNVALHAKDQKDQKETLPGQPHTPSESLAAPVALKSVGGGGNDDGGCWDRLAASDRGRWEAQLAETSSLEFQLVEMNGAIATLLQRQVGTVASFRERVRMSLPDEVRRLGTSGGGRDDSCEPGDSTPLTKAGRGDGCGAAGNTKSGRGAHTPEQQWEPRPSACEALEIEVVDTM